MAWRRHGLRADLARHVGANKPALARLPQSIMIEYTLAWSPGATDALDVLSCLLWVYDCFPLEKNESVKHMAKRRYLIVHAAKTDLSVAALGLASCLLRTMSVELPSPPRSTRDADLPRGAACVTRNSCCLTMAAMTQDRLIAPPLLSATDLSLG